MRTSAVIVFAVLLLGVGGPLWAHHAFTSEFDAAQPIQLRGTLVRAELINPHSWFHLDVEEEDGTLTRWMIEGGTPNTLFRNGITRNSLPIGTEILVDGYRSRDGSNRANGRDMTFPDGRKIFLGGPPAQRLR
jgi:hypothetical protein